MIPVQHEDIEELKSWGLGLESVMEKCYFCKDSTRYWYLPKNEPCCKYCAEVKQVSDFK